jgi:hypothetical protein
MSLNDYRHRSMVVLHNSDGTLLPDRKSCGISKTNPNPSGRKRLTKKHCKDILCLLTVIVPLQHSLVTHCSCPLLPLPILTCSPVSRPHTHRSPHKGDELDYLYAYSQDKDLNFTSVKREADRIRKTK